MASQYVSVYRYPAEQRGLVRAPFRLLMAPCGAVSIGPESAGGPCGLLPLLKVRRATLTDAAQPCLHAHDSGHKRGLAPLHCSSAPLPAPLPLSLSLSLSLPLSLSFKTSFLPLSPFSFLFETLGERK